LLSPGALVQLRRIVTVIATMGMIPVVAEAALNQKYSSSKDGMKGKSFLRGEISDLVSFSTHC
jgi:hypothetical protein